MSFRWLAFPVLLLLAAISISCSSSHSTLTNGGTGFLWLTAQGNTTVQAYTINTTNGALTLNGSAVGTSGTPTSIVITPKGDAAFISGSGIGSQSSGAGIAPYSINSDGTFKAAGSTTAVMDTNSQTCTTPMGLAINPAGTFLFVACQGTLSDPNSGAVYTFSVTGTTLAALDARMPTNFGASTGSGPVSVAVSVSGNYLYVANEFANTVSSFQISSSGALTQLSSNSVGIAPSALFVSIAQTNVAAGQYLYVANTGSNNISAFAICDAANGLGCSTPNGLLTPVTGSPFPAEPGPVAIAMDPTAAFLYVADEQANQVSEYSWSSGTGALTALTPGFISAGGSPVSLAIHSGVATTTTVAGTDYMYVPNLNGSSMSVFSVNTTTGQLNVDGSPVVTPSQPSAVIVR